jgi:hypothetical protein
MSSNNCLDGLKCIYIKRKSLIRAIIREIQFGPKIGRGVEARAGPWGTRRPSATCQCELSYPNGLRRSLMGGWCNAGESWAVDKPQKKLPPAETLTIFPFLPDPIFPTLGEGSRSRERWRSSATTRRQHWGTHARRTWCRAWPQRA